MVLMFVGIRRQQITCPLCRNDRKKGPNGKIPLISSFRILLRLNVFVCYHWPNRIRAPPHNNGQASHSNGVCVLKLRQFNDFIERAKIQCHKRRCSIHSYFTNFFFGCYAARYVYVFHFVVLFR